MINKKNKNRYIGFKLKGLPQNINAVGAKINVFIQGQILSKEVIPARGFQSSVDYKQIFGLGKFTKIDSVQVIWPNLTQSILKLQKLDTVYTIDQATQIVKPFVVQQEKVAPLFEEVKANFEKHTEDDHVDFYAERIIPRILSQEGPKAASADINGDGLADLFIGGANNKGSQIYLQTSNGDFKPKPQTAFTPFVSYEDVAAVFFDADKDGDMDLLVGSGGNNRLSNRGELNHRLFLNDGKANFTHFADAFPVFEYNTGVMVPMDYDLDGDLDVFVGARNTPLKYGVTPSSALYQNNGKGQFKDVTTTVAPEFLKLGMVTSAVWGNITSKTRSSLIVVGEYMYPVVYAFEKGKMVEQATNLKGLNGWWQSIHMADIDGDGFQDLIIGNMGENGYLKPTPAAPVKLWINDFDGNESIDKILTRTIDGKDVPVFMKGEMQEQIPLLKKENLNYEIYAKKAFQELFKKELVDKAAPFPALVTHDFWLGFVATCYSRVVYVNEPLVHYRQHTQNAIGADTTKNKSASLTMAQKKQKARARMELLYNKVKEAGHQHEEVFEKINNSYASFSLSNNFKRAKLFYDHRNLILAYKKKSALLKVLFAVKMFFKID